MSKPRYTIRYRVVRSKKEHERPASPEYQVLDRHHLNKIVGRHDFEHQAQAQIVRLCAEGQKAD